MWWCRFTNVSSSDWSQLAGHGAYVYYVNHTWTTQNKASRLWITLWGFYAANRCQHPRAHIRFMRASKSNIHGQKSGSRAKVCLAREKVICRHGLREPSGASSPELSVVVPTGVVEERFTLLNLTGDRNQVNSGVEAAAFNVSNRSGSRCFLCFLRSRKISGRNSSK